MLTSLAKSPVNFVYRTLFTDRSLPDRLFADRLLANRFLAFRYQLQATGYRLH